MPWGIVIVAGGFVSDPLASRIGSPRKALAKFGEKTSLEIVHQAALDSGLGPVVVLSGEDTLNHFPDMRGVFEVGSAIDNAIAGAEALGTERVLILPADLPLLKPEHIREFAYEVDQRLPYSTWFAGGLSPFGEAKQKFPGAELEALHLREGGFLAGSMFATTVQGMKQGKDFFNAIRHNRKSQFKMLREIGLGTMIRFFLRRISLGEAETRLGQMLGGAVFIIPSCSAETMMDFDTVADYEYLLRHR
jgi:hypothetical protein